MDLFDDLYYFDLIVILLNNVGVGWIIEGVVSGIYNVIRRMGFYVISDGDISLVVEDLNDFSCNVMVDVEVFFICLDRCVIEIEFSSVECVDNDILSCFEDDLYYFIVVVSGINSVGNIWVVIDGENEYIGIYGEEVVLGLFLIVEGNVQLIFMDFNDLECISLVIVEVLEICFDVCEIIEILVDNIECFDNNILVDLIDDIFIFEVMVNVLNLGGSWIVFNG